MRMGGRFWHKSALPQNITEINFQNNNSSWADALLKSAILHYEKAAS
jgi:hypothetical protein